MISFNYLGNLGRLGNQMFQYAALRGLSSKFGYEYCLPPKSYVGVKDPNCAQADENIFDCFKLPEVERKLTDNKTLQEASFHLDQSIFNSCPDNIDLYGYFQTEKYFLHIKEELKYDFEFIDEIKGPADEFLDSAFKNQDLISLHVRRGDYLNYTHHPVQDLNYYSTALSHFDSSLPVLIFSDDTQWCSEQDLFKDERFMISRNNSSGTDLYIQSKCKYHVIANSSFSWWGAWLADSKKVIAPKLWFGYPLEHDTKDLYCKGWIIC